MRTSLLAVLLIIAGSASAQLSQQIIPTNPTTSDLVVLRFQWVNFSPPVVTRVGNHFNVEVQYCLITCPSFTFDAPFGLLAAGSYTYEIVASGNPTPLASGAFVVNDTLPNTPALSPTALAALCALLMGVGWVLIGRRN